MSNMLRHYRRHMLRVAAEGRGIRIYGRGSHRVGTNDASRLSAMMHKARGTTPAIKPTFKRGREKLKPDAAQPKRGLSTSLLDAIRRRRAMS